MNLLQLPTEFDLPSDHADARRSFLVAEIESATPVRPIRQRPATLIAAAAAVAIGIVAVPLARGGTDGRVLAYALAAGDSYSYQFEYRQSRNLFQTDGSGAVTPRSRLDNEASGGLAYSVEQGPSPDTFVVALVPTGSERTAENGVAFPDETNNPATWPTIGAVVDSGGRVVEVIDVEEDPDVGIPLFLTPNPLVISRTTSLPFAFGPPFPDKPLEVGDSWTTDIPPLGCDPAEASPCGPQTAEHRVVREEDTLGRTALVVESTYSLYAQPTTWGSTTTGVSTNTATVWFDPDEGVLVRVEQRATLELQRDTGDETGTVMHDDREYSFSAELVED